MHLLDFRCDLQMSSPSSHLFASSRLHPSNPEDCPLLLAAQQATACRLYPSKVAKLSRRRQRQIKAIVQPRLSPDQPCRPPGGDSRRRRTRALLGVHSAFKTRRTASCTIPPVHSTRARPTNCPRLQIKVLSSCGRARPVLLSLLALTRYLLATSSAALYVCLKAPKKASVGRPFLVAVSPAAAQSPSPTSFASSDACATCSFATAPEIPSSSLLFLRLVPRLGFAQELRAQSTSEGPPHAPDLHAYTELRHIGCQQWCPVGKILVQRIWVRGGKKSGGSTPLNREHVGPGLRRALT